MGDDPRLLAWSVLLPPEAPLEWIGHGTGRARPRVGPGPGAVAVVWDLASPPLSAIARHDAVVLVGRSVAAASAVQASGLTETRRFAVVPSLRDPRWYVPLGRREVAAAAFELYTPYRWQARLARRGIRGLARLGEFGWARDQIVVAQRGAPVLEQEFERILGDRPLRLALHAGRGGRSPRVTAGVLDGSGRLAAVARVADAASGLGIATEAGTLRYLAAHPHRDARIPEILGEGRLGDRSWTLLSRLDGSPAPSSLGTAGRRFLAALSSTETRPIGASEQVVSLGRRVAALGSEGRSLERAVSVALAIAGEREVPRTIVHGDFAPWNLRVASGVVGAFDWEWSSLDGLPMFDAFHHEISAGRLLGGWTPETALERLRTAIAQRDDPLIGLPIGLLCLVNLAVRELEEGCDERAVRWFGEALERLEGDLGSGATDGAEGRASR